MDIEGNPFIIRFKTINNFYFLIFLMFYIEGNPFIIRFKTETGKDASPEILAY